MYIGNIVSKGTWIKRKGLETERDLYPVRKKIEKVRKKQREQADTHTELENILEKIF